MCFLVFWYPPHPHPEPADDETTAAPLDEEARPTIPWLDKHVKVEEEEEEVQDYYEDKPASWYEDLAKQLVRPESVARYLEVEALLDEEEIVEADVRRAVAKLKYNFDFHEHALPRKRYNFDAGQGFADSKLKQSIQRLAKAPSDLVERCLPALREHTNPFEVLFPHLEPQSGPALDVMLALAQVLDVPEIWSSYREAPTRHFHEWNPLNGLFGAMHETVKLTSDTKAHTHLLRKTLAHYELMVEQEWAASGSPPPLWGTLGRIVHALRARFVGDLILVADFFGEQSGSRREVRLDLTIEHGDLEGEDDSLAALVRDLVDQTCEPPASASPLALRELSVRYGTGRVGCPPLLIFEAGASLTGGLPSSAVSPTLALPGATYGLAALLSDSAFAIYQRTSAEPLVPLDEKEEEGDDSLDEN